MRDCEKFAYLLQHKVINKCIKRMLSTVYMLIKILQQTLLQQYLFIYFVQNKRTVKFQCIKQAGTARLKALIADL